MIERNLYMKLENIKKTNTSKIIFKWLAGCNPISNTTNILSFKTFLSDKFDIDEQDFYRTFDDLEECEVGYFSSAQPNVFHWEYNLKDIGEKMTSPTKKINIRKAEEIIPEKIAKRKIVETVKPLSFTLKETLAAPQERKEEPMPEPVKRPGRPKGAKNKPKLVSERSERLEATPDVIFIFTTKKGTRIPFRLDEVDELIKQANEIKAVSNSI